MNRFVNIFLSFNCLIFVNSFFLSFLSPFNLLKSFLSDFYVSLSLYSLFRAIQFHVIFFVCLHHTFHLRHKVVPFHNFFFLSSTYDTVSDYKRYQMLQNIPIKCYLYSLVLPTYIPTYSFFFLSSTYSIVYLRCLKICPSIFLSLLFPLLSTCIMKLSYLSCFHYDLPIANYINDYYF